MRITRRRLGLVAGTAVTTVALAGCSLLVHFNDAPVEPCPDGGCSDATAGDAPSSSDAPSSRDAGSDSSASPCATLADGAICGYLGGCQCQYCSAGACAESKPCPQGFNWEAGVDMARCCSGLPVLTNTNANCGVCGIECATAGVSSPQDCELLGGSYQCVNCAANTECWSGCCAIDTMPYHCSASDCNTGACPAGICPAPSMCVVGSGGTPNYCSYE